MAQASIVGESEIPDAFGEVSLHCKNGLLIMSTKVNARWASNSEAYNRFRPGVPESVLQRIVALFGNTIDCVVDLGCGTGLSTMPWGSFANQVIGIDPSDEMLAIAKRGASDGIQFLNGSGQSIPLPNASVDIVACHASIHWMDPEPSMAEIMRVLKPQGMFVLLNHNWPPLSNDLELDALYFKFKSALGALVTERGLYANYFYRIDRFSKWLYDSTRFEYFREFHTHQSVEWTEAEYLGFTYTYGDLALMLQEGVSKHDMCLEQLEQAVARYFSSAPVKEFMFSWRVDLFKNKKG